MISKPSTIWHNIYQKWLFIVYLDMQRLGSISDRLIRQSEYKFNKTFIEILKNWEAIVGHDLASLGMPIKISGGLTKMVLTVVAPNSSLSFIIKFNEKLIISRINSFFGQTLVRKILLIIQEWRLHIYSTRDWYKILMQKISNKLC